VSAVIVDCRLDGDGERADRLTAAYTALVRWAERGAERPGPAVVDAAASALEQAAEWYEREEPGDAPRQMRLWLEVSR
jgi:hypothetical protein